MSRTPTLVAAALLSLPALVREARAQEPRPPAPQEAEPPEEDNSFKPKTYDFNPLRAAKSIEVGTEYFKKGNFAAAKGRYTDATLYDPGSALAFEKLGEADEKLHDFAGARAAYTKYFALEPSAKDADAIKKRMEKWPASARSSGPSSGSPPKK